MSWARFPLPLVIMACVLRPCWAQDGSVGCGTCHSAAASEVGQSVHKSIQCRECHGGEPEYTLEPGELEAYAKGDGDRRPPFDHGSSFSGKPTRRAVPSLCGNCHADIERMNPFGLRTDQLARYWTSGHGKALKNAGDERVAVCIDCHGAHGIMPGREPTSRTHPLNVPDMCAGCHADVDLMAKFDLPIEVVSEYRESVHGRLLVEQGDTGSPTCATCHGNHSATPPGFANVGAVCGQCHQHTAKAFAESAHADEEGHRGCVQCHGAGEGRYYHSIRRITRSPDIMARRYAQLLLSRPDPTPAQVADAIHPEAKAAMMEALPTCMECHDDPDEDESLAGLFVLLDRLADAERRFVETALRLDKVGQGVLLVDTQRFRFEDARTHLIALAPLHHNLDSAAVDEKVEEIKAVCDRVNADLDDLEAGLRWRYRALIPVWGFALCFAAVLYVKYKRLKGLWVKPLARDSG